MRRRFLVLGAMIMASVLALHAADQALGPDERYLEIYYMIQEADSLNTKGQLPQAAAKYAEAQAELKKLQTSFPGWHENVVNFRLSYVTEKLAPITSKLPTPPPAAVATNAAPSAQPPPDTAPATPPAAGGNLQAQIAALTAQNAELQNKLKEALSVQPAAVDPKELEKANARIKELEKEKELLKTSLDQEKTKTPIPAEAPLAEQKILAEIKQKLAQQIELVTLLQKENDALKSQLIATKGGGGGDLAQELQITRFLLSALQETNISLRADAIFKEKQLEEFSKNAVPRSVYQTLERERDDLRLKLAAAMRGTPPSGVTPTPSVERDEIARQLEAAQAKLAAYEAAKIPFTPEELALVKTADLKVSMSDAPLRAKKVQHIPEGTGPLMDAAKEAIRQNKFEEAEKKYLEVLRQDEKNAYVLGLIAGAQVDQNKLDEADKTLKKALDIEPQDGNNLYVLGQLRFYQGKYDEALEALSLSAKVEPDKPHTQYFLGKALLQKGNRSAAETALRKALQLRANWGNAHYLLAFIYATQQPPFPELAQWHYDKALQNSYPRNEQFEKMLSEKKKK